MERGGGAGAEPLSPTKARGLPRAFLLILTLLQLIPNASGGSGRVLRHLLLFGDDFSQGSVHHKEWPLYSSRRLKLAS